MIANPTPRSAWIILILALTAVARPLEAQTARGLSIPAPASAEALVRQGDSEHTALRPLEALATFRRVLGSSPDNYDALWRAAREAVNLGMLAADGSDRKRWYEEAETYARQARAANPDDARGAEWLAIALGRRALDEGPRTKVRLAVEIHSVAMDALALDSLDAGAHHVLGEWHAQIRRLSGVERWMARKLLGGGVFEGANWEDAERELKRSIELDPTGLVHYLDLARVYLDLDRPEEARALLRQVLERPAVEPVDPLHKQEAQELLRAEFGVGGGNGSGG